LPAERVALARTLRLHGDPTAARVEVQRAMAQGDSSAATLVFYGEVLVQANRLRDAELAYRAAARDSALGPLAIYRRARVLVRLGDPGATDALSGFAATYASDTAAPTAPSRAAPPPPAVARGLAELDTLALAGLDSEAGSSVRWLLARPPQDVGALLGWSEGLAARGWGSVAVRLAWQAATRSPNDPRVLRAIFPWPNRSAVEAEAGEFGVDPLVLAGLVRQESVFDLEALSAAGARGLAQLLPGTAAQTARGLDVTFYPEWITVPDLNLHLGAAHLA